MLPPNTFLHNKRYKVIRRIGLIGIGSIYEAEDTADNRPVALKEMLITSPAFRRTFEQSVAQLKQLEHRALCNIKGHFVDGNWQYLVMEYIEGQDLAQHMSHQEKPFAVKEVLIWADDLLDALAYLHSQEPPLIHHDINPANLKLTPARQIVLTDFALTGHIEAQTGYSWQDYALNYASPEQVTDQITDARSDLYSLAATLYYLLTGEVPLAAQSRLKFVVEGHLDPLLPAKNFNSNVPPALAEYLTLCMALEASERPANANIMQTMLREAFWEEAEEAYINEPAYISPPEAPYISAPEELYTSQTQEIELIESQNTSPPSTPIHKAAKNKATAADKITTNDVQLNNTPRKKAHLALWTTLPKPVFSRKTKQFIFVVLLILLMSALNMLWMSWNGPYISDTEENQAHVIRISLESGEW